MCMGRYFKDCFADPGAGAESRKRSAEAWDEFCAGSPRAACSNGFFRGPLLLGAAGYSVILQQLF